MGKRRKDDGPVLGAEWRDHNMRAAVERWLAENRSAMLSMARKFEGRANRADDVVQEASLVAMSMLDKAASVSSPRKWLVAITRYVGLRVWRKRKRRARHDLALLTDRPDWVGEDGLASWREAESLGELKDLVFPVAARLPRGQRNVIMAMFDAMDDDEIAAMEGVAESTVRVRRHRAVQKLRQLLATKTNVSPSVRPSVPLVIRIHSGTSWPRVCSRVLTRSLIGGRLNRNDV